MAIRPRIAFPGVLLAGLGLSLGIQSWAVGSDTLAAAEVGTSINTQAVVQTIESRFPGAVVDHVESEVELGLMIYDIDLFHEGREISIEVSANGELLTKQVAGRLAGLPESILDQVPHPLRERRLSVKQIEIYHDIAGQGPRTVYRLEQDGRVWLLDANGPAAATTSEPKAPAASPVNPPAPRPAQANPVPGNVTPIDQVRRGQSVVLRGEVQRLRDTDEFILRDATGSIEIYIGWRNRMPVEAGQAVTVHGIADDDGLPGFRPDIYADRVILPGGETIEFRGVRED